MAAAAGTRPLHSHITAFKLTGADGQPLDLRPRAHGEMQPRGCGDTPPTLGAHAHYTTRVLRSGYLYLYDEARRRWSAYFITEGAYFTPFEPGQPFPRALAATRGPCERKGHAELASCITIPSPRQATLVWLAFSDVEWTPKVLKLHQDAGYRARHMHRLDVARALQAPPAGEPVRALSRVAETMAEYCPDTLGRAFGFSPHPWQTRAAQAQGMVDAAEKLMPGKGLVVALNDPAGMAAELAALMKANAEHFLDQGKRRRHLTVHGWLCDIESQIKSGVERRRLDAALDERDYRQAPFRAPSFFPATRQAYGQRRDELGLPQPRAASATEIKSLQQAGEL